MASRRRESRREARASVKLSAYFEAEMMALANRVMPSSAASLLRMKQYLSQKPHYSESYFLSVMLASNDDRMKAVAIKLSQNTQTPFPPRNSKSKAEALKRLFGAEPDATFMFECEERIAETAEEDAAREVQREQQEIQQMLVQFDLDKMGPETTMPESEEEESEEETEEEVLEVSRIKTRRQHLDLADLQFSAGDALAALGLPPPPKPKPKEPEPKPKELEPPVDEKTRRMTALLAMSTQPPGPTKAELAQQQEAQAAAEAAEAEAAQEEELRARLAAMGPDSDEEYADSVVEESVEPQVELQEEPEDGDGREAAPPIKLRISELIQEQEARNPAAEAAEATAAAAGEAGAEAAGEAGAEVAAAAAVAAADLKAEQAEAAAAAAAAAEAKAATEAVAAAAAAEAEARAATEAEAEVAVAAAAEAAASEVARTSVTATCVAPFGEAAPANGKCKGKGKGRAGKKTIKSEAKHNVQKAPTSDQYGTSIPCAGERDAVLAAGSHPAVAPIEEHSPYKAAAVMYAAATEAPAEEAADEVPPSVQPAPALQPAAAEVPAEENVHQVPAVVHPATSVQLASSGKQQMKPQQSAAHGKPAASAAPAANGGSAVVFNLTEKVVARRGERPPPELAPPPPPADGFRARPSPTPPPPRQFPRPNLSLIRDADDYLTRRTVYEQEVRLCAALVIQAAFRRRQRHQLSARDAYPMKVVAVEPSTVDMSIGVMTERKLRFLNRHQAETHTTWSTLNSSVDAVSASHSPSAPMQLEREPTAESSWCSYDHYMPWDGFITSKPLSHPDRADMQADLPGLQGMLRKRSRWPGRQRVGASVDTQSPTEYGMWAPMSRHFKGGGFGTHSTTSAPLLAEASDPAVGAKPLREMLEHLGPQPHHSSPAFSMERARRVSSQWEKQRRASRRLLNDRQEELSADGPTEASPSANPEPTQIHTPNGSVWRSLPAIPTARFALPASMSTASASLQEGAFKSFKNRRHSLGVHDMGGRHHAHVTGARQHGYDHGRGALNGGAVGLPAAATACSPRNALAAVQQAQHHPTRVQSLHSPIRARVQSMYASPTPSWDSSTSSSSSPSPHRKRDAGVALESHTELDVEMSPSPPNEPSNELNDHRNGHHCVKLPHIVKPSVSRGKPIVTRRSDAYNRPPDDVSLISCSARG